MTLIRWDPFKDLQALNSRFSRVFPEGSAQGTWVPAVDVFERGDDVVIRAELPGVNKDEIDIRVVDNTLVLRGERKREEAVDEGKSYRAERVFGAFTRSFSLPLTVDAADISASHKDGILEIVLPKQEEAKPRKIEVKAA